jgi:hypothetical protein
MDILESVFAVAKSKIVLAIVYPALIIAGTLLSYMWYQNWSLEKEVRTLREDKAKLEVLLSVERVNVGEAGRQLEILKEQCEGLLDYVKTKPGKDTDSDIDGLLNEFNKLRSYPKPNTATPASETKPSVDSPSPGRK